MGDADDCDHYSDGSDLVVVDEAVGGCDDKADAADTGAACGGAGTVLMMMMMMMMMMMLLIIMTMIVMVLVVRKRSNIGRRRMGEEVDGQNKIRMHQRCRNPPAVPCSRFISPCRLSVPLRVAPFWHSSAHHGLTITELPCVVLAVVLV
eukprot:7482232-Pyramimonas_sp.AAC.1